MTNTYMKPLSFRIGLLSFLLTVFATPNINAQSRKPITPKSLGTYLLQKGYDKNASGVIEPSEAEAIEELHIRKASLSSMTGIEKLVNLKSLAISRDAVLETVSLSDLPNLESVSIQMIGKLKHVDLKQLPNLKSLTLGQADENFVVALDASTKQSITKMKIRGAKGLDFDFTDYPNLESILLMNTDFEKLDFRKCKLQDLRILASSTLTDLKIGKQPNLESLKIGGSKITELNLSGIETVEGITFGCDKLRTISLHKANFDEHKAILMESMSDECSSKVSFKKKRKKG